MRWLRENRERKCFVTFRNGLMHLDIKAYLASKAGQEAVANTIRVMDLAAERSEKREG